MSSLHLIYHSYLSPRGLFGHHDNDGSSSSTPKNHTCSLPNPLTETPTDILAAGYTFHELGTIIAGAAAAFAFLSISLLMFRHATHLSKPNEQLKILRICMLIPVVAVVQFIGQVEPATYFYLTPWADAMQAFAMGNFFLLMLEFISPHHNQRELFFSGLQIPQKKNGKGPQDGVAWYKKKWFLIFQYAPVQVLVSIFTDITQAANVYCENSSKTYFAHLWLQLIHNVSLVLAVMSVLGFYKLLKTELYGHKPLSKLFAFKLMVGINFLMGIIFWILNDLNPSPLTPNSKMNQADMTVGIPALVNCLIMVPFSIFFHYAYDVGPYMIDRNGHSRAEAGQGEAPYLRYQGGFLGIRAFTGMLNPSEFFGAIAFAFAAFRDRKQDVNARAGYDDSVSYDTGYGAHEMSRRDQRRMEKQARRDHGRRYEHRGQQGYGGYDNRGYR
ncbi:hypothetical protein VM1G_02451 [Cytospora mali]|uniref:Transmembrane protein 184C n=1 Tax=Cytospora mali TaxID=578113 RepID=A0A194VT05_CYTMA|nr:hypothetical protein VM1G_02451 [Valsa mali]